MAGISTAQYLYTSAPLGGTGFHIVGIPNQELGSSLPSDKWFTKAAGFTLPTGMDPMAERRVIDRDYPVAFRFPREENGQCLVVRSQYIGREYTENGEGIRPGNFFAHGILFESEDTSRVALARNFSWRSGLTAEELSAKKLLVLPPVSLEPVATHISGLEPAHLDALALCLWRMGGGPIVLIPDGNWDALLTLFEVIEGRLTPAIAKKLGFSTYEADLSRGYDLIASAQGTALSKQRHGVVVVGEHEAPSEFMWLALRLAELSTHKEIQLLWDQLKALGQKHGFHADQERESFSRAVDLLHKLSEPCENRASSLSDYLHTLDWQYTEGAQVIVEALLPSIALLETASLSDMSHALDLFALTEQHLGQISAQTVGRKLFEQLVQPALNSDEAVRHLEQVLGADPGSNVSLKTLWRSYFEAHLQSIRTDLIDEQVLRRNTSVANALCASLETLWKSMLAGIVKNCRNRELCRVMLLLENAGGSPSKIVVLVESVRSAAQPSRERDPHYVENIAQFIFSSPSGKARGRFEKIFDQLQRLPDGANLAKELVLLGITRAPLVEIEERLIALCEYLEVSWKDLNQTLAGEAHIKAAELLRDGGMPPGIAAIMAFEHFKHMMQNDDAVIPDFIEYVKWLDQGCGSIFERTESEKIIEAVQALVPADQLPLLVPNSKNLLCQINNNYDSLSEDELLALASSITSKNFTKSIRQILQSFLTRRIGAQDTASSFIMDAVVLYRNDTRKSFRTAYEAAIRTSLSSGGFQLGDAIEGSATLSITSGSNANQELGNMSWAVISNYCAHLTQNLWASEKADLISQGQHQKAAVELIERLRQRTLKGLLRTATKWTYATFHGVRKK